MRQRHFLVTCLVALLGLLFADTASAMYHPGLGRHMQRDPNGMQMGPAAPRVAGGPAVSGGFIQRDFNPHQQYADGMNLYQYVRSNPANRVDPSGLFSEFIDCDCCQEDALKADEQRAQQQITDLKADIQAAIAADTGQYPWFTKQKLEKAIRILDDASRTLKEHKVKCVDSEGPYAKTWPWGGTVEVYKPYWEITETFQAATLVHEGTHMSSGTTDARYFWQNGEAPHDVGPFGIIGWDIIASTYDTWIVGGFCVPGHNCPNSISVNPHRGGTECPQ